jgi:hypothetical protein
VCKIGGTFVITSNPTNKASTKIVRAEMNVSMFVLKNFVFNQKLNSQLFHPL